MRSTAPADRVRWNSPCGCSSEGTFMYRFCILCLLLLWPAARVLRGEGVKIVESPRRYVIGIRVQAFPLRQFETDTISTSTTTPVADYTYTGSSNSQKAALTPSFEYRLTPRLTVGTDFLLHHASYAENAEIRSGKKDPNSSTDDRAVTTITQSTKANYWEMPALLRYYGLRRRGLLSHAYAIGGLGFRHIGRVRTGNEYAYADDTTDYDETPAEPSRRNQLGLVVGIGLRFIDDFKIKVTPEFRYTRWAGSSFQGDSYQSVRNDLRVGFGISF